MKNLIFTWCLMAIGWQLIAQPSETNALLSSPSPEPEFMAGELYTQLNTTDFNRIFTTDFQKELKEEFGLKQIRLAFPYSAKKSEHLQHYYKIFFAKPHLTSSLIHRLNRTEGVELVERVPLYRTAQTTPNDALFPQQWSLQQIQSEDAWDINTGNSDVVIAVIDDAVLTTHEDLQSKIIDEFDATDLTADANPPIYNPANIPNYDFPYFSHGTHVAGIAASMTSFPPTGSTTGIASLGGDTQILAIKTKADNNLDESSLDNPMDGVDFALAWTNPNTNGRIDVLNMSWGSPPQAFSNVEAALFQQAYDDGIVCVAAMGNAGSAYALVPAGYPSVFAVGATDPTDFLANFSNYGHDMDVCAPGVGILSCVAYDNNNDGVLGNDYDGLVNDNNPSTIFDNHLWSGTSMASPMVAALVALVKSENPASPPYEIIECIRSTCDLMGNNNAFSMYGSGRVNAYQALLCNMGNFATIDCPASPCQVIANPDIELARNTFIDDWTNNFPMLCGWETAVGTPDVHPYQLFNVDNFIHMWSRIEPANGLQNSEATKTQPLNLQPGISYQLEYDYYVKSTVITNELDFLNFFLIDDSNISTSPSSHLLYDGLNMTGAILIDQQIDLPVDILHNDLPEATGLIPAGDWHHRVAPIFTFNSPGVSRLLITPIEESTTHAAIFLNNITIRPVLGVNLTASSQTVCAGSGDCVTLTASGVNDYVWGPESEVGINTFGNQITVCPTQTTTYSVTGYINDDGTNTVNVGCSETQEITITVEDCGPCEEKLLVDEFCDAEGAHLTVTTQTGTVVNNNTFPGYDAIITWTIYAPGQSPQTMVGNPIMLPLGTQYTYDVSVQFLQNGNVICDELITSNQAIDCLNCDRHIVQECLEDGSIQYTLVYTNSNLPVPSSTANPVDWVITVSPFQYQLQNQNPIIITTATLITAYHLDVNCKDREFQHVPISCCEPTPIETITSWQNIDVVIDENIIVPNGTVLEIDNSTLRFVPNLGHITVQPGGKLEIKNNSLLTNAEACRIDGKWRGVRVVGDGKVIINTNSKIEEAITGIEGINNIGPILSSQDAFFHNNTTSIYLHDTEKAIGFLVFNTKFTSTDGTDYHIRLRNVEIDKSYDGTIQRSQFYNARFGIHSINCTGANLFVRANYFNEIGTVGTRFQNIESLISTASNLYVEGNEYKTIRHGIIVHSANFISVLGNTISDLTTIGIRADRVRRFAINDNTITGTTTSAYSAGIEIRDSELSNSSTGNYAYIKNNTMQNSKYGLNIVSYSNDAHNLQIRCNFIHDNFYGIRIHTSSNVNPAITQSTISLNKFSMWNSFIGNNPFDIYIGNAASLLNYHIPNCTYPFLICSQFEPMTIGGNAANATFVSYNFGGSTIPCYNMVPRQNMNQPTTSIQYQIAPNPTNGMVELSIDRSNTITENLALVIIDVQGRKLQQVNIPDDQSNIQLDLSAYASGIYFIQINSSEGVTTKKVVLSK